jgi:hypothetical protein
MQLQHRTQVTGECMRRLARSPSGRVRRCGDSVDPQALFGARLLVRIATQHAGLALHSDRDCGLLVPRIFFKNWPI